MFTLTKDFRFEAAHQLIGHDGKCARLHGHSWVLRVAFEGKDGELLPVGPKAEMLVDYGDIGIAVRELVNNHLDHFHLNETLGTSRPTSEFVARWVWLMLMNKVLSPRLQAMLKWVEVEETCTTSCRYSGR